VSRLLSPYAAPDQLPAEVTRGHVAQQHRINVSIAVQSIPVEEAPGGLGYAFGCPPLLICWAAPG
jgi:hypothetical protein